MSLKRIPLGITDSLAKFAKQGGQSIIYESPPNKLIKIVLSDEAADATQTSNRLIALGNDENLFRGL
jgi:hypothetical protein